MHTARMLALGPLVLLVLLAGCQRPATLNPVSGKVSFKGAALQNGVVVFTPDPGRGESGPIALGTIADDGTYTLATNDASGASAGWYRVTVASFAVPAGQRPPNERFYAPPSLLPEKYRDPEMSLLRCEIKPNRANNIDLNLD
jgi:hypothetical protein